MSSDQLREAYRLIRDGKRQQAVRILVPIVRAQPKNADAWWLLANAVDDDAQKERALQQVLKLRPDDEPARRLLERLEPQPVPFVEEQPLDDLDFDADFDADDPFGEAPPGRVRVHRSRGSSPLTIILALIGLLTVVSCAACLIVTVLGAPVASRVINDIIGTVTFEPSFATLANLATTASAPLGLAVTPPAPQILPTDLQKRGSISVGETKQATVAVDRDDSWTFSADATEHVVIELYANDASLDPHLYLYDPTGQLVTDNDDIDNADNPNSRIDITLERAGLYTIRVGKFSGGGAYALSLREG